MNLRTPRRRVSPRTKRRYRAIKNFLRRTLGSSSQPDTQINSTISVSELKHKIVGIEHQLNTVSKHCRDLACLEKTLRPHTFPSLATGEQNGIDSENDTRNSKANLKETETKIIYKSTEDRGQESNDSRFTSDVTPNNDGHRTTVAPQNKMADQNYSYDIKARKKSKHYDRLDTIRESNDLTIHGHKNYPKRHNLPGSFSITSFRTLNDPKISSRYQDAESFRPNRTRKHYRRDYSETNDRLTIKNNLQLAEEQHDHMNRKNRSKNMRNELDQDFIADIIRRQYRPVKLFGRRESDYSQFSAPVCRDQEFPVRETVLQETEVCSCCHDYHRRQRHSRYMCCNDLSDIRSICDTRLYSSKKQRHHRRHRECVEDYNDSALYDIVPVKEKCSPKSRRKFVEDNMFAHQTYKEVPPSPRTQRPRLNLKAQYRSDDEDALPRENQLKYRLFMQNNVIDSNMSSEVFIQNRTGIQKSQIPNIQKPPFQEGTMSSLQYQLFPNEQNNNVNDTTLNTQTDISADKTDKTLSEIKDILQNFLQEIKKEASQSEKLNCTPKTIINAEAQEQRNITPPSGHNFNNNCSFGQCSLPPCMQPPFANPCCYPILPVCPLNCMQNGFVMQTPSATCAACANNLKDIPCNNTNNSYNKNTTTPTDTTNTETQMLIKEIHKFLSENPNSFQKRELSHATNSTTPRKGLNTAEKTLTSRSVGGSSRASKHDAKVGTTMKCYSKSCEAIGSRLTTDTQNAANACYSDTILEKGSFETTAQSSSESDYSSESTDVEKAKGSKFKNILRSIGILKKNKKDVIEELSESGSSTVIEKPKKPPFQQNIMSYAMHGQEYFHPPPIPPHMHHQIYPHQYEYYGHLQNYDPRACHAKNARIKGNNSPRHPHPCNGPPHYRPPHHLPPCANYYDPHYNPAPPPLCLKEIEVKSIGTQSVRKMSLLKKFTNKMQVPVQQIREPMQKQSTTQTAKEKPGANLFNWKNLQAKATQGNSDPLNFSYKAQKQLAEGDIKMRNAMLKKLFYKRNPFSPRNLLVKTLLGRDKSSYGEPPKMYKPKMFL